MLKLIWRQATDMVKLYYFGVADRFDSIKFDVWLKQAFCTGPQMIPN